MDEQEVEAIRRVIHSGWITMGPETEAFEGQFAQAVGSRFACAVSSGTAALHLALLALGLQPGDEVITVSSSFIATANSIRYCGAKPVFVDIELETFNINPDLMEQVISPRTRASLCVHQMGMPCDLEAILKIARKHRLGVVEDAACALGSRILFNQEWQAVGRPQGDVACFSFHPRKAISIGDGGMLTTNDPEVDRKIRLLRNQGMDRSAYDRFQSKDLMFEQYDVLGYNYRMTDIQAAIGRVQLTRLSEMVRQRRRWAGRYTELLQQVPGIAPPHEPSWAQSNWQSYCVKLDPALDQRTVMRQLRDRGIATQRGIMCAHREPAYPQGTWTCGKNEKCECAPYACERLRNSEWAQDHAILLPLYPQMTEEEQDTVVKALWEVVSA